MRLADIAPYVEDRVEDGMYCIPTFCKEVPELLQLIKTMATDEVFESNLLATDEVELAALVASRWKQDPCYQPSMTLLQAIRSINAKVAISSA